MAAREISRLSGLFLPVTICCLTFHDIQFPRLLFFFRKNVFFFSHLLLKDTCNLQSTGFYIFNTSNYCLTRNKPRNTSVRFSSPIAVRDFKFLQNLAFWIFVTYNSWDFFSWHIFFFATFVKFSSSDFSFLYSTHEILSRNRVEGNRER